MSGDPGDASEGEPFEIRRNRPMTAANSSHSGAPVDRTTGGTAATAAYDSDAGGPIGIR